MQRYIVKEKESRKSDLPMPQMDPMNLSLMYNPEMSKNNFA